LSAFFVVTGLIITGTHEISSRCFISLRGATKFKLTGISLLAKISSTLLGLIELVIGGLDAIVRITVFPGLHGVEVFGPGNFFLVTRPLLLELVKFVTGVVDLFAESVATVGLLCAVTLSGEDLSLATGNLFTS
jgi:hypothetical protein